MPNKTNIVAATEDAVQWDKIGANLRKLIEPTLDGNQYVGDDLSVQLTAKRWITPQEREQLGVLGIGVEEKVASLTVGGGTPLPATLYREAQLSEITSLSFLERLETRRR